MAYHLSIELHPTYVHAVATGETTSENLRRFLLEAYQASVAERRNSLLLELRFSGPSLNFGSVYSVIAERSLDGATLARIAYVDASPEHAVQTAEFAELAAQNRGINVRLFSTIEEAKRWLEGEKGDGSPPPRG
jgi:hypothetical protein